MTEDDEKMPKNDTQKKNPRKKKPKSSSSFEKKERELTPPRKMVPLDSSLNNSNNADKKQRVAWTNLEKDKHQASPTSDEIIFAGSSSLAIKEEPPKASQVSSETNITRTSSRRWNFLMSCPPNCTRQQMMGPRKTSAIARFLRCLTLRLLLASQFCSTGTLCYGAQILLPLNLSDATAHLHWSRKRKWIDMHKAAGLI